MINKARPEVIRAIVDKFYDMAIEIQDGGKGATTDELLKGMCYALTEVAEGTGNLMNMASNLYTLADFMVKTGTELKHEVSLEEDQENKS